MKASEKEGKRPHDAMEVELESVDIRKGWHQVDASSDEV